MKTTIAKSTLAAGLRKALSAVNAKTTIPVLNNVLLEADDNGLTLTATDLEVCICCTLEATVERSGKTTLPGRKFGQIVNALPEGDVILETDDNQQTAVSCKKSFFRILGLDADEFPLEDPVDATWSFSMPANTFKRNLNKVSYAASTDETRHVLNGTLLSIRGGILTTVSTDGRRLALVEHALETEAAEDCDVILPDKVVGELLKVLEGDDSLKVELSDARAAFSMAGTHITTKLVEGNYPNYRQVVPESFGNSAVIPRDQFSTVLNRVAMVVSENNASVILHLDNAQMTISASSVEFGEASEPLDISYDGQPIEIAFNPTFLADPLRHLESDQVVLQFNDEFNPVSVSADEGFLCVLMPMRT